MRSLTRRSTTAGETGRRHRGRWSAALPALLTAAMVTAPALATAASAAQASPAGTVRAFFGAEAAGDWTAACASLTPGSRAWIVRREGPRLHVRTCAAVYQAVNRGLGSRRAAFARFWAHVAIVSVRVRGQQAIVRWKSSVAPPEPTAYLPLHLVEIDGRWFLDDLANS